MLVLLQGPAHNCALNAWLVLSFDMHVGVVLLGSCNSLEQLLVTSQLQTASIARVLGPDRLLVVFEHSLSVLVRQPSDFMSIVLGCAHRCSGSWCACTAGPLAPRPAFHERFQLH